MIWTKIARHYDKSQTNGKIDSEINTGKLHKQSVRCRDIQTGKDMHTDGRIHRQTDTQAH